MAFNRLSTVACIFALNINLDILKSLFDNYFSFIAVQCSFLILTWWTVNVVAFLHTTYDFDVKFLSIYQRRNIILI
jgi:hypothetical protein